MLRTVIQTTIMSLGVLIAVVAISIWMTRVEQNINLMEVFGHSIGNMLVEHVVNVYLL